METGYSYFEGATVEREYEKKFKGQTNIYDRLKCRPILKTKRSGYDENNRYYNSSTKMITINKIAIIFLNTFLFSIFSSFLK